MYRIIKDKAYFFLIPKWKKFKRKWKNDKIYQPLTISKEGKILEIGPFYNPICVGNNVKYFDILTQDELEKRAESLGLEEFSSRVPFIHFVSKKGDLAIIQEKFDTIVSSHVIEHQPDLISHLQQVSDILSEGGNYFLKIPDKRFCFDHFMIESTIAEILDAYYTKKRKHSLKSVIEHRALTTHNDPSLHWKGNHGEIKNLKKKINSAITEYYNKDYVDVHAWYFTPVSFKRVIDILRDLEYIDFVVDQFEETRENSFEFSVILSKTP